MTVSAQQILLCQHHLSRFLSAHPGKPFLLSQLLVTVPRSKDILYSKAREIYQEYLAKLILENKVTCTHVVFANQPREQYQWGR